MTEKLNDLTWKLAEKLAAEALFFDALTEACGEERILSDEIIADAKNVLEADKDDCDAFTIRESVRLIFWAVTSLAISKVSCMYMRYKFHKAERA